MEHTKFIAYFRVSTTKQGNSGLGIEAQEASVKQYCSSNNIALTASYTEVETGKKDSLENRPVLQKVLGHCKRIGATLIIAKLDRLSRSVRVTSLLHSSNIEFIACDFPSANRFTIQILAAVAENEARMISDRTKAALGALKARGVKLGSHRPECAGGLTLDGRQRGGAKSALDKQRQKVEAYSEIIGEVFALRKSGMYLRDIAKILNDRGETTRTGCRFKSGTIHGLLQLEKITSNLVHWGMR